MREQRNLVSKLELDPQELKEALFLMDFLEGISVIEGRKGSGKTLLSIGLAWKLRELFGIPIICDFRPKGAFGPYTFLDERKFIGELTKITEVAKYTPQEDIDLATEWALSRMKIDLTDAIIILDEAYRYFDCRTPGDKLVRIFGYFIAQSRHYKNTILLLTPDKRMLDKRVRQQVDFHVRVAFNEFTSVVHARILNQMTGEIKRMKVFGPNYFDMYDSWSPIALRKKVLELGET